MQVALRVIQKIEKGEVLAIMFQDKRGVFFHFRPGDEAPVVQYLAGLDWKHIQRSVEEHIA